MYSMEKYSYDEKRAIIAFLNMVITVDLEVQIEEQNLLWMFSKSIHVDLDDAENMSEEEFNKIRLQLSIEKMIEIARMGLTLLKVDKNHQSYDQIAIKLMLGLNKTDEVVYEKFYKSMNTMTDLTPLDQVVLIVLAYHMAEADGILKQEEIEMLTILCSMIGVKLEEVPLYKIPKDALFQALLQMNPIAVRRLVEELLLVSMADLKISEQEYDFIFPILSHFKIDFETLLQSARYRFNEHIDYYELFLSESPVS